jgi:hypothetical protein
VTARALLAASLLVLGACSHAPLTGEEPKPGPDQGAWAQARDRQTRAVRLYDGLALRAFATVVWESPEVRAARVDRVAVWKAMTDDERAASRHAEDETAAVFDELTVALFTPDRNDNDLDANQSNWRLALVTDAGETVATKVTQLRIDSMLRTLYPRIGDFDVVYRVRFPKQVGLGQTAPFVFRMAGPRGKMDFGFGPPVAK